MVANKAAKVKRPRQKFDVVEVIWDDASAHKPEWTDTVEVEPALVISVGFLVFCNRSHIVIAQDLDADGEHNGRTQIPRGMVKSLKVLTKKDG